MTILCDQQVDMGIGKLPTLHHSVAKGKLGFGEGVRPAGSACCEVHSEVILIFSGIGFTIVTCNNDAHIGVGLKKWLQHKMV